MAKKRAGGPAAEETNGKPEDAGAATQEPPSIDELRRQHYEAIREKETEVAGLEQEMLIRQDEYKRAKKVFEGGQDALRALIRRDPSQRLLFDDSPEEDAWRSVNLDELGIDGKTAELLTEAKLATLGAIADWSKEYELTDIEGIGPAKAEQLQAKLDQYWADNPPITATDREEFDASQQEFKEEVRSELEASGVPVVKR